MTITFWHTIFWISYAAWALFEMWVSSRDRHAVEGHKSDRGSIFVLIILIMAAIYVAFLGPRVAPWAQIAVRNSFLPIVAATMIWGGMAFRLWAINTLGSFFRTTVTVHDDHKLVTDGPYRILRHPAYTGAILTISGFGLFMNNWMSFLGALAASLIGYGFRVWIEERVLSERFGDTFKAQHARSWAVFPFIW